MPEERLVVWDNYRPSNGTEGAYFMAQTCDRCEADHQWHDEGDGDETCPILMSSMVGEYSYHAGPNGPPQWHHIPATGESWCEAFIGPCECDWQRDAMTWSPPGPSKPQVREPVAGFRLPPRQPSDQLRLDL